MDHYSNIDDLARKTQIYANEMLMRDDKENVERTLAVFLTNSNILPMTTQLNGLCEILNEIPKKLITS